MPNSTAGSCIPNISITAPATMTAGKITGNAKVRAAAQESAPQTDGDHGQHMIGGAEWMSEAESKSARYARTGLGRRARGTHKPRHSRKHRNHIRPT
jgi:hypothetical protein